MKRAIEAKMSAAAEFTRLIAEKLAGRIYRVVLFGSVAKGIADRDSDIDILIVVDRADDVVERALADVAFDVCLRTNESIEYISMGLEEYLARRGGPFIYEVERCGKKLYLNGATLLDMARKLVELANEYAGYAEKAFELMMYRAAIDLGQNAVKLLLKALIIARGRDIPKTHGGYIHVFGELYVLTGRVEREIISALYKALEARNKARYDPDYAPAEDDAKSILDLYARLVKIASEELRARA